MLWYSIASYHFIKLPSEPGLTAAAPQHLLSALPRWLQLWEAHLLREVRAQPGDLGDLGEFGESGIRTPRGNFGSCLQAAVPQVERFQALGF